MGGTECVAHVATNTLACTCKSVLQACCASQMATCTRSDSQVTQIKRTKECVRMAALSPPVLVAGKQSHCQPKHSTIYLSLDGCSTIVLRMN
jgi:hypothetical protein